ncbi:MAG TPA: hypothetical protein VJV23_10155 [Candidatus Polarisedimenticolia bacterium]|nr:hypothetical protein [Candidatus Polarisedimenticolia bacterium]
MPSPRARSAAAVLAAALVAFPPAAAQDAGHEGCAAPPVGWVPAALLEREVPLREGTGNARETVSTASAPAQSFYDQGLNYLHGYVWIEAARSFRQALRHDDRLAMAWIGLSRAYSGLEDAAAARAALEEARVRASGTAHWERRRIELRGMQLDAMARRGDAGMHRAYRKALDDALAERMDDPELWLLRGNAEEAHPSGRGQRGGSASTAFYHRALEIDPGSAAAHHYLTHSYENIGAIDKALEHGEAYARAAPSIPHAHHMWGHDLRRVGRIDDAIAAFLKADELERAYYEAEGIPAWMDWHHGHNLNLLAGSHLHKGQRARAEALLRKVTALEGSIEPREFEKKDLPLFLLASERWQEALDAARPLISSRFASTRAAGHALAGHALLGLGRTREAQKELKAAGRAAKVRGEGWSSSARPYVDGLRGEILLHTGKRDEGRAVLIEVERAIRAVPGPDAWAQALFRLEAIGRTARRLGDWELAEHTARQMMEHDPAYGGSRLASALAAARKGDREQASRDLEEARRLWKDADAGVLKMVEAGSESAGAAALSRGSSP